jgi:hypothetical protein
MPSFCFVYVHMLQLIVPCSVVCFRCPVGNLQPVDVVLWCHVVLAFSNRFVVQEAARGSSLTAASRVSARQGGCTEYMVAQAQFIIGWLGGQSQT